MGRYKIPAASWGLWKKIREERGRMSPYYGGRFNLSTKGEEMKKTKNPTYVRNITQFRSGHYYRFTGSRADTNRGTHWAETMYVVLDHNPRLCIGTAGSSGAVFDGIPGGMWFWGDFTHWEEVMYPDDSLPADVAKFAVKNGLTKQETEELLSKKGLTKRDRMSTLISAL